MNKMVDLFDIRLMLEIANDRCQVPNYMQCDLVYEDIVIIVVLNCLGAALHAGAIT